MSNCLVIIDVQNGFLSEETKHVPNKIKELLNKRNFDYIVATKFSNPEGSPYEKKLDWYKLKTEEECALHPFVRSVADIVIKKNIYSCFTEEFVNYIEMKNIKELCFVGIDTDCCVLKSATDCFEKGLDYEVVLSCCASNGGAKSHEAAVTVLERTIGESYMIE